MVATFLNNEQEGVETEATPAPLSCPTGILDLSLRQLASEWSDTMLTLVNDITNLSNSNTLRWQDKVVTLKNSVLQERRVFYLGITFIIISFLLFYFEITS